MDMMTRRRAMMAGIALPEWDFEWYAIDKITLANSGFTVTGNGTNSEAWGSSSLWVTAKGTSSWRQYVYPYTTDKGVFQIRISHSNINAYFHYCFGNGTNVLSLRSQYSTNYKGLYLYNATSAADRTKIATLSEDVEYEIRMVHKGTSGDVYLNESLIASDIDLSTLLVPFGDMSTKGFRYCSASSVSVTNNVYALKMRFGRTT